MCEYVAFRHCLSFLSVLYDTDLSVFHNDIFHMFNMLWLFWMVGSFRFLKPRQFHLVYLAGGVMGAAFMHLLIIFSCFAPYVPGAIIIGSSASVMAIAVATATLVPDYSMNLMFIGNVKLKYLLMAYIVIDLISIASQNPGGSCTFGGALFGLFILSFYRAETI
ncbi:hypothetical protein CS542_06050 [Pedobacter sp. IW39]|nr:hypothetical protein CS542_06050 [Pedobacter sp. IW39]